MCVSERVSVCVHGRHTHTHTHIIPYFNDFCQKLTISCNVQLHDSPSLNFLLPQFFHYIMRRCGQREDELSIE